ncbi:MAG TPA: hypothetical protein VF306_11545 [Pirellulales bacterium]
MSTISPDLEQFVPQEISSGRFANRDAVIEHALRFLQQDREEAIAGITGFVVRASRLLAGSRIGS